MRNVSSAIDSLVLNVLLWFDLVYVCVCCFSPLFPSLSALSFEKGPLCTPMCRLTIVLSPPASGIYKYMQFSHAISKTQEEIDVKQSNSTNVYKCSYKNADRVHSSSLIAFSLSFNATMTSDAPDISFCRLANVFRS